MRLGQLKVVDRGHMAGKVDHPKGYAVVRDQNGNVIDKLGTTVVKDSKQAHVQLRSSRKWELRGCSGDALLRSDARPAEELDPGGLPRRD